MGENRLSKLITKRTLFYGKEKTDKNKKKIRSYLQNKILVDWPFIRIGGGGGGGGERVS